MEKENAVPDNAQEVNLPPKSGKKAKFKRWKVVFYTSDIHPRVMLKKTKVQSRKRTTTAKLHLAKSASEKRKDVVYFYPNPNPKIHKLPGAYYSKLKNDNPNDLIENTELNKWKISSEGKKKMRESLKEKERMRKTMEKKKQAKKKQRAKKKQAYPAKDQTPRRLRLCKLIKSLFRKKGKKTP